MNRRALTLALVCSALAATGLVACGEDRDEAAPVDTTPIVGLMEIPISRNNQGTQPSGAALIEISPGELRLDHTKVVDLERGRPADAEVSEHVISKLRQGLSSGAARSRAAVKVHATVPYLTLVETLNTLQAAGLGEVSFAVRNLGQSPQESWMTIRSWHVVEDEEAVVRHEGRARVVAPERRRRAEGFDRRAERGPAEGDDRHGQGQPRSQALDELALVRHDHEGGGGRRDDLLAHQRTPAALGQPEPRPDLVRTVDRQVEARP